MQIFNVKCFGDSPNSGNISLVILESTFSAIQKQEFARIKNVPACVFIEKLDSFGMQVEFYYPHRQSPLCLHGSLAAAYVYFELYPTASEFKLTTSENLVINLSKEDNSIIKVELLSHSVPKMSLDLEQICKILNVDKNNILNSPVVASVGSPKALIEIDSVQNLYNMKPNLKAVSQWVQENKINGFYVYYRENEKNIIGRNFNHIDANHEDSATGVAAGALCSYLKHDLLVSQGENLGNPCLMKTYYYKNKIELCGIAVPVINS